MPSGSFRSLIALRHRNFRLIWWGLLGSFTGSFMQNAAILWHVSLLAPPDRKALALGAVGLVRIVPILLFSMVSGVAADALDRRRLLLGTQIVLAVLAGVLAVVTLRGLSSLWPIYVVTMLGSAAGAFDLPARQALVPMLVPREHLPNALSLQAIALQTALVAGPSIGGIVIATAGVGWVYLFNAVSFGAVVVALLRMRDVETRPAVAGRFTLGAAFEGLRFVFTAPLIRSTMLLDFFATFFSSAMALLPIFAQDILHVGAHGYGWLYAAPAVGAVFASAAMVAAIDRIERRGYTLLASVGAYGLATVVFGLSPWFWLTFLMLAVSGAADAVSTVFRNVIRQLETPDAIRGRMTGVNMVFFLGGPQLGEVEAGLVANWIGAPLSVVTGGLGCLAATWYVAATTPRLRAYRREERRG
jgi:MFS family permease